MVIHNDHGISGEPSKRTHQGRCLSGGRVWMKTGGTYSELSQQAPWHTPVLQKPYEIERVSIVNILQMCQLRHRHSPGQLVRGQNPAWNWTLQMSSRKCNCLNSLATSEACTARDPRDQDPQGRDPLSGPFSLISPAGGSNLDFSTRLWGIGSSCLGL